MSQFKRTGKLVITCDYKITNDHFARWCQQDGVDPLASLYDAREPMMPFLVSVADLLAALPELWGADGAYALTDFTVYTPDGYDADRGRP